MDILYVAQWAGAEKYGMVYGQYYLAREWVRLGHNVTVLSASYSHTRFRQPDASGFKVVEEYIDGIRYLWLPVNTYRAEARVGRLLSMIVFSLGCFFVRLKREFDVVISSSHHPFSIFFAHYFSKKVGATLVFEVRDLWPLSLICLGGLSYRHPVVRVMGLAESYAYKKSDLVISTLESSSAYMVSKGMREEKFSYIPNGVTECPDAFIDSDSLSSELLAVLNDGRFIVVYCGNVGVANNLEALIRSAMHLDERAYAIIIIGDGPEKNRLECLSASLGIGNVYFFSRIEKSKVAAVLRLSDVAFISYIFSPLYEYGVSPTKLNDYALAQVPVLFSADFDLGDLENREGLFRCVDNELSVASSIRKIAALTPSCLAQHARSFHDWLLETRNYETLASDYLKAIDTVGNQQCCRQDE